MPTNEVQLVTEAKRLARLRLKRSTLRKQLKDVEKEIKLVTKNLKALAQSDRDPFVQMPPMRFEE